MNVIDQIKSDALDEWAVNYERHQDRATERMRAHMRSVFGFDRANTMEIEWDDDLDAPTVDLDGMMLAFGLFGSKENRYGEPRDDGVIGLYVIERYAEKKQTKVRNLGLVKRPRDLGRILADYSPPAADKP